MRRSIVLAGLLLLLAIFEGWSGSRIALAQAGTDEAIEPARYVFLLGYIARDYELAVKDGAIINAFEYREIKEFTALLHDRFEDVRKFGAPVEVEQALDQLVYDIDHLVDAASFRSLASTAQRKLAAALDVLPLPTTAPDLASGERLYTANCAICHGESGAGDGESAAGLDPPPTSFRGGWSADFTPQQIHAATSFGIEGTAMPGYRGELSDKEMWDLAFFLMTLDDAFEPSDPGRELPLSLEDLSIKGDSHLAVLLRARGFETANAGHVQYYRAHPELARIGQRPLASAQPTESPVETAVSAPAGAAGGNVALALQNTFASVAEDVAPSVVGVTTYMRAKEQGDETDEAWRLEESEARYTGYRRSRSGSGFFVDEEYLLTTHEVLFGAGGREPDLIDVELSDGGRVLGSVVGSEPTINLAVLRMLSPDGAPLPRVKPARIGKAATVKPGHWAIALGNPWGPGKTFAVGMVSSLPERECYQENLSATLQQLSIQVGPQTYGGPFVNIAGEVVGIIMPDRGGMLTETHSNTTFALPIDLAMTIFEPLKQTESRKSPWLGVAVVDLGAARRAAKRSGRPADLPRTGVYIDATHDSGPAVRADIHVGDSLVSIDGQRLFSVADFQRLLYLSGIGRSVRVEVYRGGETLVKNVTIEERPGKVVPR